MTFARLIKGAFPVLHQCSVIPEYVVIAEQGMHHVNGITSAKLKDILTPEECVLID